MQGFNIEIIKDNFDLEQVYKLRYKISVEELGQSKLLADHSKKMIYEKELDNDSGLILGAFNSEKILIGTMRVNFFENIPPHYNKLYILAQLPSYAEKFFSFSSRLVIEPLWRKTSLFRDLFKFKYRLLKNKECYFNFIHTYPHLLKLYKKLGYRQYGSLFTDVNFGELNRMVLLIDDVEHLKKVKSPLRQATENREKIPWHLKNFIQAIEML